MKILVTGGTGSVGTPLVALLVQQGHDVTVIGRRESMDTPGATYRSCSVEDVAALRRTVPGHDGIIHLAAIPNPDRDPPQDVFRVNTAGTFNLYQVAAECGVKRVVSASSINALGFFYGVKGFDLPYFPLDENVVSLTTDPYSFSKVITERIAEYFWERNGISSACLRIPGVYPESRRPRIAETAHEWRRWVALPQPERLAFARNAIDAAHRFRAAKLGPDPRKAWSQGDPALLGAAISYLNFWTLCSANDSAQAFAKAVLADYTGAHTLFINSDQNSVTIETELLLRAFFPEVTTRRQTITGDQSLISIDRARSLIDFQPVESVASWCAREFPE